MFNNMCFLQGLILVGNSVFDDSSYRFIFVSDDKQLTGFCPVETVFKM